MTEYRDLGTFSGLVDEAKRQTAGLWPNPAPSPKTRAAIKDVLGFAGTVENRALDVRCERSWQLDGLECEELSWQLPYGPRTMAWLYRPAAEGAYPGVVAFHCHGRLKFHGKEKIADGPGGRALGVDDVRDGGYSGRVYPADLARRGFVVLVHDAFMWGSRRFELASMPSNVQAQAELHRAAARTAFAEPGEWEVYNAAATPMESTLSKYAGLLGTTVAGIVAYEDRAAISYLRSRSDVRADAIGTIGFSGGGARVALAAATTDDLQAGVIVGQMSTEDVLLSELVEPHTWMFVPPGLSRVASWPALAASAAPMPVLVINGQSDQMYTNLGQERADALMRELYRGVGAETYECRTYDAPHCFNAEMQADAFDWLVGTLSR